MSISKKELIRLVSTDTDTTQKQVGEVMDSLFDKISNGIVDGVVKIDGFGTLEKVHRRSRIVLNPQTGKKIVIEAKNAIRFKPSGKLKKAIN